MIDINSNCSRVDAVKAMASQLKMQAGQVPHTDPADDRYRQVQGKLATLDTDIKKGDAKKAEAALSSAKNALKQAQTQPATASGSTGLLNTYA